MKRTSDKTRGLMIVAVVCLVLPLVSGCVWAPELGRLAQAIEEQMPGAHFEKEFAISLGPITLGLARMASGMVHDDDVQVARSYLGDVRNVQVAVYKTHSVSSVTRVRMPKQLERLQDKGWETAVRVREDDEVIWVMYRSDDESIRELYVVVLDDSELVMVKVRGNLERIAGKALAEASRHRGMPDFGDEDLHSGFEDEEARVDTY